MARIKREWNDMREQMGELLRNVKKLCHKRGKEAGKVQEKLRKHMHAEAEKDRLFFLRRI